MNGQMATYLIATNNISISTSNRAVGRAASAIIKNNTAGAITISCAAGWIFVGAAAPTTLAAGKVAIISLQCIGTTENDVIAAWAVQL
jgi:hypothetical protein